jgi:hypothetical protein
MPLETSCVQAHKKTCFVMMIAIIKTSRKAEVAFINVGRCKTGLAGGHVDNKNQIFFECNWFIWWLS